ncbi:MULTISPECIES: heparan-alpha-glucosaminide N-acetyltransferase domain-containing protein [Winogradskyella]|uniref:heparan-alpha-glucosaminide N-acetyltransferase domain-containing protein n=1 Tax=Winogradskyella TaxID=286104 RepID=UPI0015C7808F|nr:MULTISPECIES: heparan-alpha-glucosaminide N-acetyltransferase domain-containing protein [Winogradskyella]QXP79434.1 DUF1624 domain-containing protein [Winogradskyella sp. HaHa_3_26]
MSTNRLYFIDAVRAFAILMMLQGHFIDTLLETTYRDHSYTAYRIWEYFRGITAPTFFTISGLIFSFLLIKAKQKGKIKERIHKGLSRGLMLIGIGYLLRAPIFEWFLGIFNDYFLVVDVLQCIGLSLILIVFIYKLVLKKTLLFSITMFVLGFSIFITEPLYRTLELPGVPLFISNYFIKANGSVFNIIPWFGYVAFGAFISTLFYKYVEHPKFKTAIVSSFFIVGILLIHLSSDLFLLIDSIFNIPLFTEIAIYNYLFIRLGNVLVIFSIFYLAENYVKQPLVLRIGQKTLSIYVIHFIIIYGSFTGLGLNTIIGRTLDPLQAIIGAIIFLAVVCFISFYYAKTNAFLYFNIQKLMDRINK